MTLKVFYHYGSDSCLELDLKNVSFGAQTPGLNDSVSAEAIDLIEMTTRIVNAYVSHNTLLAGELPRLITDIDAALRPAKAWVEVHLKRQMAMAVLANHVFAEFIGTAIHAPQ